MSRRHVLLVDDVLLLDECLGHSLGWGSVLLLEGLGSGFERVFDYLASLSYDLLVLYLELPHCLQRSRNVTT